MTTSTAGEDQGHVHYEFILERRTISKEMYIEILRRHRDAVRRKHTENCHEIAGFFCMTTHLHISRWWSKRTLPSTM
jgi:hypothetical protein